MGDHTGASPQGEGAEDAVDLVGTEVLGRGVAAVQHVLQHLEAQAHVGAHDEAVRHRPDDHGGESEEQQETDALGGLLDERRGEPGLPVRRPALPEELRVSDIIAALAGSAMANVAANPPKTNAATARLAGVRSHRSTQRRNSRNTAAKAAELSSAAT